LRACGLRQEIWMGDTDENGTATGTITPAQLSWIEDFLGLKPPPDAAGAGSAAGPAAGGTGALAATDTDLFFDKDSSELTKDDRDALERYANAYLAANSTEPITIEAWASKEGDEKHNKDLANARAKKVHESLAGLRIPSDRLKATGSGAASPSLARTSSTSYEPARGSIDVHPLT